jgi:hypothetical protein
MARGSEQSGEGELLIAGRAADELAGVGGDGSAEIADPVGEAAGCCARVFGDFRKFVAEQVDRHTFEAVGQRVRPQACHDVVAVEAAEVVDHILDSEVWASHGFLTFLLNSAPAALDWLREHASQG